MNRAARRRAQRGQFKAVQAAKRLEKRAHGMTPAEARQALGEWAALTGRSQDEVDALNGKGAMALNVRKLFNDNCGAGARYVESEFIPGGEGVFDKLQLRFRMVPEGRIFNLDHTFRESGPAAFEAGVLKLAAIARDIRDHIKPGPVNGHRPN